MMTKKVNTSRSFERTDILEMKYFGGARHGYNYTWTVNNQNYDMWQVNKHIPSGQSGKWVKYWIFSTLLIE